jgi:antitoxin component YwqK of YwqJK toxin-antitoxin module
MKTRVDKEWFKNGKIKSEYNYKIGFSVPFTPFFKITFNVKEDGIETHWYENGQKQLETNNRDGNLDGLSTMWYENGQKKVEVTFKEGKIVAEQKWHEDGSLSD